MLNRGLGKLVAGLIVGGLLAGAPAADAAKPAVRVEEQYGKAEGRVQTSKIWTPVTNAPQYNLDTEVTDKSLVFTCPAAPKNTGDFGYASGIGGDPAAMPLLLEMRMKLTPVEGGQVHLYYCCAPNGWLVVWDAAKVYDAGNPDAPIAVDTTKWQTYRLIARSPTDVRLFVDGVAGDGIPIKSFNHSAQYFQLRVFGHGSKAELEYTRLTDAPAPAK
jgi:hypothetical protein